MNWNWTDLILDWHPIVLLVVGIIVGLVVYFLYSLGNSSYKKTKYKGKPFLSGNSGPEKPEDLHVGGSNLYWGFTQALKRYFDSLVSGHTGIINDYLYWFMITLAVVMVVLYFV